MKEIKLSTASVFIHDTYKRKQSKAYNRAMYGDATMDIDTAKTKSAEDVKVIKLPLINSMEAKDALVKAMIIRIEEEGKEVVNIDEWLDELDNSEYQAIITACEEVQGDSEKKVEAQKKKL